MKSISWSQMSMFEKCPRLWYEVYVVGQKKVFNEAFYFGGVVHSKLQAGLLGQPTAILEKDLEKLESSAEAMAKLGSGLVNRGLESLAKLKFHNAVLIEETIEYPDYKGVVDLVFQSTTNKIHIVDWKTTSTIYTPHQVKTSGQLTGYAWLYYRKYHITPDFVHFITLNKKIGLVDIYTSTRDKDDFIEFERRIADIRTQMNLQHTYKKESACIDKWGTCEMYEKCWDDRFYQQNPGALLPKLTH